VARGHNLEEAVNMGELGRMRFRRYALKRTIAAAFIVAGLGTLASTAQQPDSKSLIQQVDAAVKARNERIAAYSVTEHYAVYRGQDENHPAAEMTVKTVYRKESGKNYTILSESGSEFIRKHVLYTLLDHEKEINLPGNRERSWFISANYAMNLKLGSIQRLDGRDCLALAISPKRKAPNMIEGTLWVDARDGSIVRLEGTASQSPSVFTGPAQVMRQYARIDGFGMATHARAVSDSILLGRTTVTIDYADYKIQILPAK
jgi:outer membrane lipoprotein-sorting protein